MLQLNISVAYGELRKIDSNTFSKCISDLLGLGGVMVIFQPVFCILSSFAVSLLLELNRAMNKKRCCRIMLQPCILKSTII